MQIMSPTSNDLLWWIVLWRMPLTIVFLQTWDGILAMIHLHNVFVTSLCTWGWYVGIHGKAKTHTLFTYHCHVISLFCVQRHIVGYEVKIDINTYACSGSLTSSILFYSSLAIIFLGTLTSVFPCASMLVFWHLLSLRYAFLPVYSILHNCLCLIHWQRTTFIPFNT